MAAESDCESFRHHVRESDRLAAANDIDRGNAETDALVGVLRPGRPRAGSSSS
jgi:hypothetical protein